MSNLQYQIVGSTLVVLHGQQNPTDAEWNEYLGVLGKMQFARILAVSHGGAPTGAQRDRMQKVYQGDHLPLAVVTDALLTRAILSVSSLIFLKHTRAFSLGAEEAAMDFLGVATEERIVVMATLESLRRALSAGSPGAPAAAAR